MSIKLKLAVHKPVLVHFKIGSYDKVKKISNELIKEKKLYLNT